MTLALLLISDGREDYLDRTLASATDHGLLDLADQFIHVDDSHHQLGFAGAIQAGWGQVRTDYVFHLEQDFTFLVRPPVAEMIATLAAHPHLVQMALLRQPWSPEERAAGGIVQLRPETYQPESWHGHVFLTHRNFTTTNPCIWPRWVIERGWPARSHSEGWFGIDLFASDPALRSAYWGSGEEWVTHIGDERSGRGY